MIMIIQSLILRLLYMKDDFYFLSYFVDCCISQQEDTSSTPAVRRVDYVFFYLADKPP